MSDKSKPHSSDSQRSKSSIRSVESIGIGASEASCRLKTIIPDGFTNPYDRLYDCVVLLIHCPQHHKVAVVNTRREHIVWAPFIQLRDGLSWAEATLDVIQQTIGRQDAEMNQAEAEKLAPKFELDYLEVTQIQVPSVNYITRVCQLVTLQPSGFKCCTKGRRLDWVPLSDLAKAGPTSNAAHHIYSHHWGPELRFWSDKLQKMLAQKDAKPAKIIRDKTVAYALEFYGKEHLETAEHKALLGECNLSDLDCHFELSLLRSQIQS